MASSPVAVMEALHDFTTTDPGQVCVAAPCRARLLRLAMCVFFHEMQLSFKKGTLITILSQVGECARVHSATV